MNRLWADWIASTIGACGNFFKLDGPSENMQNYAFISDKKIVMW